MAPKDPKDATPIRVRITASSIVAVLASWPFAFRRQARIKRPVRRRSAR